METLAVTTVGARAGMEEKREEIDEGNRKGEVRGKKVKKIRGVVREKWGEKTREEGGKSLNSP